MKNVFTLLVLLIISCQIYSQNKEEILEEAYLLYNSEKASWNGTDIFLKNFPEKRNLIGGYFSYSNDDTHKCVFFSRDSLPSVLVSIAFNSSFLKESAIVGSMERKFTNYENDLYKIRKKALEEMNSDTLFKQYSNTNFNTIPIIINNKKKVYVLTGAEIPGVVVFGNDYLITFDRKGNIKSKKCLHNNIITIEYSDETKNEITYHNHSKSTSDLITATDICTLMLYEKQAKWKQHYVFSEKNVSIWDCEKDELIILTKKAWDRINEHQRDKDKKNN